MALNCRQGDVIGAGLPTHHARPERLSLTVLEPIARTFESDELIQSLVQGYPEAMAILNEHRQVVACNKGLLDALGLTDLADVLGGRLGEALSCEQANKMPGGCGTAEACRVCGAVNAMLECDERCKPAKAECRISTVTPDGPGALELEVVATPFAWSGHKFMIFAAKDISAHKRREVLEKLFLHDTLNVAGGIEGLAQLLEHAEDDTKRLEYPKRLSHLSRQLTEQIRCQRDLAAAERGELDPTWVRLSVAELFDSLRSTYDGHPVARDRRLDIVAPAQTDLDVDSDPILLGRVLGNLTKNALEASDAGQTVRVRCQPLDDERVRFTVHNKTVMPEHVKLQMFQRSFSTKGGTGRGLGTFSVKLLATQYLGGQIDFRSEQGEGTTFYVTLPQRRDDAAEVTAPATTGEEAASVDGLRILLAEDGVDNQRLISHVLTKAGAEVTIVENGKLALDAALRPHKEGRPFDAILMDMQMPVMDGYEATRSLRASGYDGAIIALTAHSGRAERDECIEAGCDAYASKPVDRSELLSTIARLARNTAPC